MTIGEIMESLYVQWYYKTTDDKGVKAVLDFKEDGSLDLDSTSWESFLSDRQQDLALTVRTPFEILFPDCFPGPLINCKIAKDDGNVKVMTGEGGQYFYALRRFYS